MESQSSGFGQSTGLASEDALVEEAVSLNELALMGSMLLSLIKFDSVCAKSCQDTETVLEEQRRNQVLMELKGCDESL